MKRYSRVLYLLTCFFFANSAFAENELFGKNLWGEFDRKQQAFSTVKVYDTGRIYLQVKYSNGKQYDGDTFLIIYQFLDAAGNNVAAMRQGAGVNGSGGGRAREVIKIKNFNITPDQAKRITDVKATYTFVDTVDDRKVWEAIRTIAEAIFQYEDGESVGSGGGGGGGGSRFRAIQLH